MRGLSSTGTELGGGGRIAYGGVCFCPSLFGCLYAAVSGFGWRGCWNWLSFSCGVAHCGEILVSVFQGFFASIGQMSILAGGWALSFHSFLYIYILIFFSLLVIYIYTIFMGDTMYYLYLFIQAVRPVSHYAILMFQLGLMICVNVI